MITFCENQLIKVHNLSLQLNYGISYVYTLQYYKCNLIRHPENALSL